MTRAAERLHISQPAVSKQLRELERSLGMALFHRLSKGVRLTEAGELLAGYARRLFDLEAEAERALAELRGLERGRLRVGASTTIGIYLLPEVFAAFQQQYPGVELQLEIANTREIQRRMLDNELDLGLTEGVVEGEEFEVEIFLRDAIVAIVPPSHALLKSAPVTAETLCREPMVAREAGSGTRSVVERALADRGLTACPAMALGSTEAIKRAVAAGVGVALVSRLALGLELEVGKLSMLPVVDLEIYRPLHRLKLRGKYEGRAVREFLRLLRQSASRIDPS